jgi:hypothetical protein
MFFYNCFSAFSISFINELVIITHFVLSRFITKVALNAKKQEPKFLL